MSLILRFTTLRITRNLSHSYPLSNRTISPTFQLNLTLPSCLLHVSTTRKMPAHFYTYDPLNPSAVNTNPAAWHWENPADWPRTYLYVSNQGGTQGIHPPAPVYQSNQPAQQAMYYFQVTAELLQILKLILLTLHPRAVPALRLVTTSMASLPELLLPLPQLVGPTPTHPPPATLAILFPPPLLRPLHRTTRTTTHHIAQQPPQPLHIRCHTHTPPQCGLSSRVQHKPLPP